MTRDTLENLHHEVVALTEERTGRLITSVKPEVVCYGLRKYIRTSMDGILFHGAAPCEIGKTEIGNELSLLVMRTQLLAARLDIDLCEQIHHTFNDTAIRLRSERRMIL